MAEERTLGISYDVQFNRFVVADDANNTFSVGDDFAYEFEHFVQTNIIAPGVWTVIIRNWASVPLEIFGIVRDNLMARGISISGTLQPVLYQPPIARCNLSDRSYTLCQDKYVDGSLGGTPINKYAWTVDRRYYLHKIEDNRFDAYTPLMRKSRNSNDGIYVIVYAGETTKDPRTASDGPGPISDRDVTERVPAFEQLISTGDGSFLDVATEFYEVAKQFFPGEEQFVRQFFQLSNGGGNLPNQGERRRLNIGQQNYGARIAAQNLKQ